MRRTSLIEPNQPGTVDLRTGALHLAADDPKIARRHIIAGLRHPAMPDIRESRLHAPLLYDNSIAFRRQGIRAAHQAQHFHVPFFEDCLETLVQHRRIQHILHGARRNADRNHLIQNALHRLDGRAALTPGKRQGQAEKNR